MRRADYRKPYAEMGAESAQGGQHAAVATLALRALAGADLATLLDETVVLVARTLRVAHCAALELLPDGTALLLRAGVGWTEGLVGRAMVEAGGGSPAGAALLSHEPVVVEDLRVETRFRRPPLLMEHGAVSGVSVIIPDADRPFGVLEVFTTQQRAFAADEVDFLQAMARVLTTAIERAREDAARRESEARFRALVEHSSDFLWQVDERGVYTYCSPNVTAILGYAPEELLGKTPFDFMVPEAAQRLSVLFQDLAARPEPFSLVVREVRCKDGSVRFLECGGRPVVDEHGNFRGYRGVDRDITERKQVEETLAHLLVREQAARVEAEAAQQRLAFLTEASTLLADSLDYETTLQNVARLAVPHLADWCTVHIAEDDGALRRVAVVHADPAQEAMLREIRRRYPLDLDRPHPVTQVLTTGRPLLYPAVPEAVLETIAQDAAYRAMIRAVGIGSVSIVPLQARGRTLGTLTLVSAAPGRYGPADLALAEELARRAALAIDNARLYRAAEDQRRRLEGVLEQSPAGITIADATTGRVSHRNSVALQLWPDLAVGESVERLRDTLVFHPDGRPYAFEERPLVRALRGEAVLGDEVLVLLPDGGRTVLLANAAPVYDGVGQITAAVAVFQDVTERTHYELEREWLLHLLTASDARLRAVLEALEIGVSVVDSDHRIVLANRAYRELLGLQVHVIGQPVQEVRPTLRSRFADPETFDRLTRYQDEHPDQVHRAELTLVFPRRRVVRRVAAPVLDGAGSVLGHVTLYQDITEQWDLDRLKDSFIAAAAHELRTPLTGLMGFSQLLHRQVQRLQPLAPELQEQTGVRVDQALDHATHLVGEAERLNRLVSLLLDMSRIQAGRFTVPLRPLDVARAIPPVVERLRMAFPSHTITYQGPTRRGFLVLGDAERLEQVVTNLVENAVRYSPHGSPIAVRLQRPPRDSGQVLLSVRDAGLGLSPEERERVFERMYRGPEAATQVPGGLGLGLYLCAGIVEQLGGRIWAESEG
ncbi:MAG: PAS domain S-box protein, partial [Chloroflexi bacterium]|nr:PAS domain S-box protein [Chloroflexota bacterium]